MTREQIIADNDLLRREFKGGKILMTPAVHELNPQLRAAAFVQMSKHANFAPDSLHDSGMFILGHLAFVWEIRVFATKRSIILSLAHEWAGVPLPWDTWHGGVR